MQPEVEQYLLVPIVMRFADRVYRNVMVLRVAKEKLPFLDRVVGVRAGAKSRYVGCLDAESYGVLYTGLAAGSGRALCVVFV